MAFSHSVLFLLSLFHSYQTVLYELIAPQSYEVHKLHDKGIECKFFFLIQIQLKKVYYFVLISAVQPVDSIIHIDILFRIFFHCGLSQDSECSSLCYTVGPFYLPILCIVVASANPSLPICPSPPSILATTSLFSVSVHLFHR